MKIKKETKLKNHVYNYLKDNLSGAWWKTSGNIFTNNGLPDIIGCYNGKFVGIELKLSKGVISPIQRINAAMIAEENGLIIIIKTDKFDKTLQNNLASLIHNECGFFIINNPF